MHRYLFIGLAYKRKVGGSHHKLKEEFPGLEQAIQLDDIMENDKIYQFFRKHFRAFLHYLEDTEPALTNHTGYMKKMHKHILKGLYKKLMIFGFDHVSYTLCQKSFKVIFWLHINSVSLILPKSHHA